MALVALGAVCIRAWDIGAPYGSGDQATMPYLVRHSYGIQWILERDYGPMTALASRAFAGVLSALGVPMSETTERLPILLLGVAQVIVTYPLMRRLRCPASEAVAGSAMAAVLPMLVADSRMLWGWGFLSMWLLSGTIALWATLAYLDDRKSWQLVIAGGAMAAHCLSNVYAFALPATLMVIWIDELRHRESHDTRKQNPPYRQTTSLAEATIGFLLPCITAITFIFACWWFTGQGQLGHLLEKQNRGTAGLNWDQIWRMPAMWSLQLGYLSGIIAAAGLVVYGFARCDRRRLLALWAGIGLIPVWFLADWDCIGYPAAYFIDISFVASLLGVSLVFDLYRRAANRPMLRLGLAGVGVLALAQTTVGTVDDCLGSSRLAKLTGIANKPVQLRDDIGAKAAGQYVRTCVPMNATVLSLHDNKGMEVVVAEYYLGRRVLAGYDQKPETLPALLQAMRDHVDVIIVPADYGAILEATPEFSRVCTIRDDSRPILFIHARPALRLPAHNEEVSTLNRQYDTQFQPRHVPIALPEPPDFARKLAIYQDMCKKLKTEQAVPVTSNPMKAFTLLSAVASPPMRPRSSAMRDTADSL